MDILIKSFNRPYYLARCIASIYANVLDRTVVIKVLDDGTPLRYLEKIQTDFPEVIIEKSAFYKEKSASIFNGGSTDDNRIPIDLWLNAAKKASDYFVLLEDDIWFTQKINLQEIQQVLKVENSAILKLYWLNNPKLVRGKEVKLQGIVSNYKPLVYTKFPFLHRLIFGTTRFGIRNIMQFLGLYSSEKALEYYSIYGVAGAIFEKKYFLDLWSDHNNQVDENLQLKNAVKFWYKNPNIQFARTKEECVMTSFLSSATNKNYDTGQFDVFEFNKIMNEAWFEGKLEVNTNFSTDLDRTQIEAILLEKNNPKASVKDWNVWILSFKKQFKDMGCAI